MLFEQLASTKSARKGERKGQVERRGYCVLQIMAFKKDSGSKELGSFGINMERILSHNPVNRRVVKDREHEERRRGQIRIKIDRTP